MLYLIAYFQKKKFPGEDSPRCKEVWRRKSSWKGGGEEIKLVATLYTPEIHLNLFFKEMVMILKKKEIVGITSIWSRECRWRSLTLASKIRALSSRWVLGWIVSLLLWEAGASLQPTCSLTHLRFIFSGFIFKPYNNEVEKIVVHNNRNGQLFIVKITIKNTWQGNPNKKTNVEAGSACEEGWQAGSVCQEGWPCQEK